MNFIWPVMLYSLLLIPIFIVFYFFLQRRRRKAAARYGNFGLAQDSSTNQIGFRRHIPPTLFLFGLSILFFALARPQTTVDLPRVEGTVILAFDVSGSMAATDLKPTRMDRSEERRVGKECRSRWSPYH